MKKIIAAALMVLMVFSLVACGNNADVVKDYVEENEDELIAAMESVFSGAGMSCSSTIKAEGAGFIMDIRIDGWDDVDSDTKAEMKDYYGSMQSGFDSSLKEMQTELPELEYFEIRVCEEDGDVVATIRAED